MMKVKVTTLTGDKHELEVAPQDTVRHLKKFLYELGKVTSQVRLLQGQTVLEDDRKLSEYSLLEGATISVLFEPDVDINIEVKMSHLVKNLTVSNAVSIMALKAQINGIMRCGLDPEKLEIRLGDVTLEDSMPLHFYGVKNGSTLNILKPYVGVTIENNHGTEIFWRLHRKDTIKEAKTKLAMVHYSNKMRFYLYRHSPDGPGTARKVRGDGSSFTEMTGYEEGGMSIDGMRLYLITGDRNFNELDDDKTVEKHGITDDSKLYLLSYSWSNKCDITVMKTGRKLHGIEEQDTCLGIKVRVQDQTGLPVASFQVFLGILVQYSGVSYDIRKYNLKGGWIQDTNKPLMIHQMAPLVVITEEEIQAECARKEEERKAQEEERKVEAAKIAEWRAEQALRKKRQREELEAAAASVGLTVEEYLAEQARKEKEERKRQIQAKRDEQAKRRERQGYYR